jgi:hypothetical protein
VITAVLPLVELLLIVTCPLAEPVDVGLNSICNVTDCVGFSVIGKLSPGIVNPVPLIATEFTVTGEVPVDVRVRACVAAVFTITLPKFSLTELTASSGLSAAVLVPLREMTVVPPTNELLLIVSCPLADPVATGSNCTCSVIDWVGLNVAGRLPPTRVNPAPVTLAESTVTGAVPVEIRVTDRTVDVFSVTLPKFSLPALTVSCGLGAAVLVPLRETTVVLPVDELLRIVSCPLDDPVAKGLNSTCSVTDCIGFNVVGRLAPTRLKPAPVTVPESTVTGAVPVDVSVRDCVIDALVITLPKLRLPALTVN